MKYKRFKEFFGQAQITFQDGVDGGKGRWYEFRSVEKNVDPNRDNHSVDATSNDYFGGRLHKVGVL